MGNPIQGLFLPSDNRTFFRFLPLDPINSRIASDQANIVQGTLFSLDYEADVLISESESIKWTVSSNITEDGNEVFDHKAKQPSELTVEFMMTDTPIGVVNGLKALASYRGRSRDLYERFKTIASAKDSGSELVTIVSGLQVYRNYVLTSLDANRNNTEHNQVRITCEFKEFRVLSDTGQDSLYVDDNIADSVGKSEVLGLVQLVAMSAFLESKL